ncbi:TA system VapC family ribonuclease toxin [Ruania albidiflava]|uniref:TA system VapC family ribonuclease toxin n=1 Tax=Ruania albidiflava TaxID=366586 RepID=UPI0003B69ECF|nr:TA system VapC family ribonuclease toxin [Ruania albidiflava]
MTFLLDANVLIALTVAEHEHHDRAAGWLRGIERFALCPIVEGALVRFVVRIGERARTARLMLEQIAAHPRCEFWADDLSYRDVDVDGLQGHRQVTDTYLVALAAGQGAHLATFDRALARSHPTTTLLVR